MKTSKSTAYVRAGLLLAALFGAACSGDGEHMDYVQIGAMSAAGGPAPASDRDRMPRTSCKWTGIQSCTGSIGYDAIDTTSDRASLGAFTKTETRVRVSNISVGPSPAYSCSELDVDAAVTESDETSVHFETKAPRPCVSSSGRALVVAELQGYDFDSHPLGGDFWDLTLAFRLEEPDPENAGTLLRCNIELHCK